MSIRKVVKSGVVTIQGGDKDGKPATNPQVADEAGITNTESPKKRSQNAPGRGNKHVPNLDSGSVALSADTQRDNGKVKKRKIGRAHV